MKRIKNLVATFALAGIIVMAAQTANAGFLVSDFTGGNEAPNPCAVKTDVKVDSGIIVSFTGIIVSLTDVIYRDISCGLLMSD